MPIDSATFRENKPLWTQEHELAATLIEVVDAWGRLIVQSNAGRVDFGKPLVVEHPERPVAERGRKKSKKGRLATPADIASERG